MTNIKESPPSQKKKWYQIEMWIYKRKKRALIYKLQLHDIIQLQLPE